jgi:hypothetical protein
MGAGASTTAQTAHSIKRQRNRLLLRHFNRSGGQGAVLGRDLHATFVRLHREQAESAAPTDADATTDDAKASLPRGFLPKAVVYAVLCDLGCELSRAEFLSVLDELGVAQRGRHVACADVERLFEAGADDWIESRLREEAQRKRKALQGGGGWAQQPQGGASSMSMSVSFAAGHSGGFEEAGGGSTAAGALGAAAAGNSARVGGAMDRSALRGNGDGGADALAAQAEAVVRGNAAAAAHEGGRRQAREQAAAQRTSALAVENEQLAAELAATAQQLALVSRAFEASQAALCASRRRVEELEWEACEREQAVADAVGTLRLGGAGGGAGGGVRSQTRDGGGVYVGAEQQEQEEGKEAGTVDAEALSAAAKMGDTSTLRSATRAELLRADSHGGLPLYHACHCGQLAAVSLLRERQLAGGGDGDGGDGGGGTGASGDELESALGLPPGELKRCMTNALNEDVRLVLLGTKTLDEVEAAQRKAAEQRGDGAADADMTMAGFGMFDDEDEGDDDNPAGVE